ncbi:ScbA/BarX family gamma-butyrolactone biosynthesis protein [Streptomyces sp. P17]|uniref:ScbA/BarX family gamma-butyrolactone biosynthesis protein n=1 Tax=Streptomyces sp. P17 TaxID=3074716 RepID=UPI0028F452D8|nr:ScbA/BarX family gamma-butyrolactone biosynthesis protein [Streptomyces sp. P17]MDT9695515.1 ScbA/BarX family gamma-butyrolactone biosynthesis protein [Streptomyces sp. P17]
MPAAPVRPFILSPEASIDTRLVHRTHRKDVLPTGITKLDDRHYTVSTRWPADHRRFTDEQGNFLPSLVIESIRQAVILVAHDGLGVPLGHQFLVSAAHHRVDPNRLLAPEAPARLDLDVSIHDLKHRRGVPSSLEARVVLRVDGEIIGTGGGDCSVMTAEVYRRLRRGRTETAWTAALAAPLPAPVPVHSVGRTHDCDVALAPGDEPGHWLLRADVSNELMFDHPNDHMPAMVLLDAAQQAAHIVFEGRPFLPSSCVVSCSRYVEFDSPCTVRADLKEEAGRGYVLSVTGHQGGEQVFEILFRGLSEVR